MFSAWPSNAMGLRALQKLIVEEINGRSCQELTMGPLITISQSAHIYDDCWESVDNLIATQYPKICRQREYSDPSGSFLIEAQPPYVVAHHLTPGAGEKVATYRSASALGLIRQIAASAPAIQGEHALYLGLEIQKAAIAMNNNLPYIQDRPLEFEGGYRVDGIKSAGSLAWNVLD